MPADFARPVIADLTAVSPRDVLTAGVESLSGGLQPDGVLHDPVFGCPTQYGSAYYGWCCAVLAGLGGPQADLWRRRAGRVLAAALRHTADSGSEPWASGFDRRTLSVTGRMNHRDFTWPPILRTYRAMLELQPELRDLVAGVDVEASFRSRPPSNWAAVWLSGEWLRMQAGVSPTTAEQLDGWIDVFFDGTDGTDATAAGFDLELGMYRERGLPNAYDLFTRWHLTDLLMQGYAGRNRERLTSFLTTGLHRSLNLQLSDGSMASGYRSTGQTWVLGAQVALFTGSRVLGLGTADDRESARHGAWRAFTSLATWQRRGGVFSPVQNRLRPELRVGYETYTADGHYSPLALAFLASAIVAGFGGDHDPPSRAELDRRGPVAVAEGAPTFRGLSHRGRVSVAVQSQPDDTYDAAGLVDLTFGTGRLLQFVSAARHVGGGPWLVPGLAVRDSEGAAPVTAVCSRHHESTAALARLGGAGLTFRSVLQSPAEDDDRLRGQAYGFEVHVTDSGVDVVETLPGRVSHRTLLIPYVRDLGADSLTRVAFGQSGVRFVLGEEWVEFTVADAIERRTDLPYGYESRRGLCGLVRLDLTEPGDVLRWRVLSSG